MTSPRRWGSTSSAFIGKCCRHKQALPQQEGPVSRKFGLGLFLLLCVSWHIALAQLTGGTVVGNVKDPTGALVPDSQITIKNSSNGTELNTVSSKEGIFTFGAVPVGQ